MQEQNFHHMREFHHMRGFHRMRGFQGFQGISEIPNICLGAVINNIGIVPNSSSLSMMNSQIKSDPFLGFCQELFSQINKSYHQCVGPSVDNNITAWLPSNIQSYPVFSLINPNFGPLNPNP